MFEKNKNQDGLALINLDEWTLELVSSMFCPFVTNLISTSQLLSREIPIFWFFVVPRYYQKENKVPPVT